MSEFSPRPAESPGLPGTDIVGTEQKMLRLDRFPTVYFGYPFKQALSNVRYACVPILMYHGVREQLDGWNPYYETRTSPAVFAAHMKFLREKNYKAINLSDLISLSASGSSLVSRHASHGPFVAITFDDGYQDFYTHAFPILRTYGFTATVFLPTARIQDQRKRVNGNEYLTWAEVRELHQAGITMGSHTISHPELKRLPTWKIEHELGESKRTIEDKLGASVKSFAYPYAFPEGNRPFSKLLEELLESHGYENGVTTIIGMAGPRSHRYFLPRLPVNNWDDEKFFRAKLAGGYDWLHVPQLVAKKVIGAIAGRRTTKRQASE